MGEVKTDEPKAKFLKVVYAGERLHGDKLWSVFFQNGDEEKDMLFKKPRGYHSIGTTYLLEKTADKKYSFPRYGLKEPDKQIEIAQEKIEEWKLDAELAESQRSTMREREKIDNSPEVLEALKPLGEMYYKATNSRKAAIEVAVNRWLRNYWPEK